MNARFILRPLALVSFLAACGLQTACELLVQLDRGAVMPADAGCPICTSLSDEASTDSSLTEDVAGEASNGEAGE
jgi:hypothetical protein